MPITMSLECRDHRARSEISLATGNQTTFRIVDPQCSLAVHKEIVDFYGFEFGSVAWLEIDEFDAVKSSQTAV